ncbi:MAG: Type 1 glutamine amidotransferase-like domain-containing protein [Verrucomicrobia bacterium]|nr:Type 1 glutamine amidotransferase-like domain-containing protein [Verrucomicrobiota bacterium]
MIRHRGGAICWFEQAVSDSVMAGELHPLKCLGLLPGTASPHYDEPGRRETFHDVWRRTK